MAREILSSLDTKDRGYIVNSFFPENEEFFGVCEDLAVWCVWQSVSKFEMGRNRTYEQLAWDLNVAGTQVFDVLEKHKNYFSVLVREKHRNAIQSHLMMWKSKGSSIDPAKYIP